ADHHDADGPHQIAEREHAEGRKQLGHRVLVREEVMADRGGEIAVDRKVVPFEHVADQAGGDHPAHLRRIHLAFPASYRSLGATVSFDNSWFCFSTTVLNARSADGMGVFPHWENCPPPAIAEQNGTEVPTLERK